MKSNIEKLKARVTDARFNCDTKGVIASRSSRYICVDNGITYASEFDVPSNDWKVTTINRDNDMSKNELIIKTGEEDLLVDNLIVIGKLIINSDTVKSLPCNLTVDALDISDSLIESLPSNFKCNGDIIASYSCLKFLPNNLTVKSNLLLDGSMISFLPKNLTVLGLLDLSNTKIAHDTKDCLNASVIKRSL